jgi:putative ABC transport system permease protein
VAEVSRFSSLRGRKIYLVDVAGMSLKEFSSALKGLWVPWAHDFRHSVRTLKRSPGFTCFVVAALGLGIGANTLLFTVANAVLLKPLPYDRPEELVEISAGRIRIPLDDLSGMQSISGIAAFTPRGFDVDSGDGRRNVYGNRITPNLFVVLGVRAQLGRAIAPSDDGDYVVMLSYDYWRRTSGDPKFVGTALTIDNDSYTVVGILPPDFTLQVRDANLFVPQSSLDGRVIARLSPGATPAHAQAEALSVLQQLKVGQAGGVRAESVRAVPLREAFRPGDSSMLFAWQAAVALVLLITCANVGNLVLVRSAARRREIAIRTAVGAGRMQVARQLLTESALLGLMGGALGIILTAFAAEYLQPYLPANIGRMLRGADPLGIDVAVVLFTLAASTLAVVLFGLAPALSAFRFDLMSCLRDSAKGATPERQRLGRLLVAAEVALTLVLLVGAGLTIKSLAGLERVYLGFSADHVLRVVVEYPARRYPSVAQRAAAFDGAIARLSSIPGVERVGALAPQFFPFGGPAVRGAPFEIAGRSGGEPRAEVYTVSPEYFRTVQIPLLKGRLFTDADTASAPPVALLSDIVARRNWPGEDPVGRLIRLASEDPASPWVTVVGVVGDIRNPVGRDLQPTAYRPLAQNTPAGGILLVRTRGDAATLAPAIQRELRALDPAAPEFRIADLERAVANYISPQRFSTSVFTIFATVGLMLSAIGVYGVMRYWVSVRIPEFGVRIALGASRRDVIRLVLRRALSTTLWGVLAGTAASLALHRVMESQLYGVSPTDLQVLFAVIVIMSSVACIAALLPAYYASRIDAMNALRYE